MTLRIIGGHDANPGQFPYHVSLQKYLYPLVKDSHTCGGSIIDESWILTAAHCFIDIGVLVPSNKDTMKIKAGRHDISKDHEVGEQVIEIDKIITHDSFSGLQILK